MRITAVIFFVISIIFAIYTYNKWKQNKIIEYIRLGGLG